MPTWCFPHLYPFVLGILHLPWCRSRCSPPCLLPSCTCSSPVPAVRAAPGCWWLLAFVPGAFNPSVPTPRNAESSHVSPVLRVAARAQLGAAGLGGQGAAGGAPQLGQGLSPLCHLPGCCPHQCQCFHSLSIHPLTLCVQRCPSVPSAGQDVQSPILGMCLERSSSDST